MNKLGQSGLPAGVAQDSLFSLVNAYKDQVKRNYIFAAPNKAYAYFALFQQIDGLLFFDLYDRNDVKAYGAVATSYDHSIRESAFETSLQPDFAVYEGASCTASGKSG